MKGGDRAARANQERKAWLLATALHRRGMTVAGLLALPYTSKSRSVVTVTKFCRTAYLEAGAHSNPPHAATSETWLLTADLLKWMAKHPGDDRTPAVDMADDRDTWLPKETPCPTLTPEQPAGDAATTSTTTTPTAFASCGSILPSSSGETGQTTSKSSSSATADGRDRAADFPRHEGAHCACGTWHRRYGHLGHGALCDECREKARAVA